MNNIDKVTVDMHRRLTQMGGLLLGIGLGISIARFFSSGVIFDTVQSSFTLLGLIVLIYEQSRWNKLIERKK